MAGVVATGSTLAAPGRPDTSSCQPPITLTCRGSWSGRSSPARGRVRAPSSTPGIEMRRDGGPDPPGVRSSCPSFTDALHPVEAGLRKLACGSCLRVADATGWGRVPGREPESTRVAPLRVAVEESRARAADHICQCCGADRLATTPGRRSGRLALRGLARQELFHHVAVRRCPSRGGRGRLLTPETLGT